MHFKNITLSSDAILHRGTEYRTRVGMLWGTCIRPLDISSPDVALEKHLETPRVV